MDSETALHATLALMLGHELDAVARHEWRLFPGLRALPDRLGRGVFVILHVPLFAVLFRWLFSPSAVRRRRARTAFAAFAVVHAWLHRRFRDHPDYEFDAPSSRLFILGAALSGAVYLLSDTAHRHHQ